MARPRVEPLSATSYRVEFTAGAALRAKLEHARNLLSHAVPNHDIARIIERALDQLIAVETKRRSGAGTTCEQRSGAGTTCEQHSGAGRRRKRRAANPGSRHVPVAVQRAVRERDGDRCTFTDAEGRRCSERRFLTIEHIEPFALGGPTTVENCTLLCKAHNAHRARQVYGRAHIREKITQARARRGAREVASRVASEAAGSHAPPAPGSQSPTTPDAPSRSKPDAPSPSKPDAPAPSASVSDIDVYGKVAAGLVKLGFARAAARRAVKQVRVQGVDRRPEPVLRAALALLTPS